MDDQYDLFVRIIDWLHLNVRGLLGWLVLVDYAFLLLHALRESDPIGSGLLNANQLIDDDLSKWVV